ncbi:conjugal transfer protein [Vibrio harveyi]|uniref:conjugal transfer protein n=1 Tax=Vibrio harveyi TaxID=669 RepID=UPI003CEE6B22
MKRLKIDTVTVVALLMMCAPSAMAAGGLDVGTEAVTEIRTWFYGFLGTGSLGYVGWNCWQAMTNKQQWNEVATSVGHVAMAGGSVLAADWAWSLWGS